MASITSANVANAIVKLVAADALPVLMSNLVMGNLVNRDFEASLAQAGDTVNVPIPPTITANNLAEGGSVSTQNPNLGNAQIILDKHKEATFVIPDVTKVLAVPDLLKVYMEPAVVAIATAIEADLLSLWPLFTANTATGGSSTMDEARIDSAETTLFTAQVPAGQKYLVVHQTPFGAMRQIARFTEYQMVGAQQGQAITSAQLPGAGPMGADASLKSFLVFRSQNVPISTTYKNLAFHRNAIGLVVRRLPQPLPGTGAIAEYAELGNFGMRVTMSYAPNTLSQQFTVDVLYGCGVLRNNHGVLCLST